MYNTQQLNSVARLSSYTCNAQHIRMYCSYMNIAIDEREFEKFINILNTNDSINKISISSSELGVCDIKKMKKYIVDNSKLEEIEIDYSIFSYSSLNKLMKYIGKNNNIDKISILSPNYLTDKTPIFEMLEKKNNLKNLTFSCGLDDIYIKNIINILTNNKFLEKLCLAYNKFNDNSIRLLAKYLESNESLKYLDISNNNISHDGLTSISNSLINNSTLVDLSINCKLDSNNIAIQRFFIMMTNNKYITSLSVDGMINDITINKFIEMITTNNVIEKLFIHDNNISDENMQKIFIGLEKNTTITNILLKNVKHFPNNFKNTTLKMLGIEINMVHIYKIAEYLNHNPNLTVLSLYCKKYTCLGTFFRLLENNCTLEKLVLYDFADNELIGIKNVFKLNKNLKTFAYICHHIDNDILSTIIDALEFNNTLEEIYLSLTNKSFAIEEFKKILETNYALKYIDGCMDELGYLLTPEAKATRTKFLRTKRSI